MQVNCVAYLETPVPFSDTSNLALELILVNMFVFFFHHCGQNAVLNAATGILKLSPFMLILG
jgi:hypothetical protein